MLIPRVLIVMFLCDVAEVTCAPLALLITYMELSHEYFNDLYIYKQESSDE